MLHIPHISQLSSSNLENVKNALLELTPHNVACVNWPNEFPDKPKVNFRIAHNGRNELFIHFNVKEETTLAKVQQDNGEVWTDSCVEFFMSFEDDAYYNFEFTCIGKVLAGYRKVGDKTEHGSPAIMQSIKRLASLGDKNFAEKSLNKTWELTVAIPTLALFKHNITNWKDITMTCNLYKCGDNLSKPHFLSWQAIDTEQPNFHVPRCFGTAIFEY